MNTTETPTREALDRRRQIWDRQPDLHYDEVITLANAELAAEQAEEAERHAKAKEITDSMSALWSCGCCAGNAGPGAQDGLCPDCRPVVARVIAERRASQLVNGRSRRELAEAYVDYREQVEGG
jgi:hypothetical protein